MEDTGDDVKMKINSKSDSTDEALKKALIKFLKIKLIYEVEQNFDGDGKNCNKCSEDQDRVAPEPGEEATLLLEAVSFDAPLKTSLSDFVSKKWGNYFCICCKIYNSYTECLKKMLH